MGAWAHDEKNEYSDLDSLAFDPSILLIVVGCLMFVVTFCGCVGALRENKILLHIVSENYNYYNSMSCIFNLRGGGYSHIKRTGLFENNP